MPNSALPPSARLSSWSYALISVYAVAGYFAGQEYSRVAGLALTVLGLATGWGVATKLTHSQTSVRVGALLAPLVLALLAVNVRRAPTPRGLHVQASALNGTWVSQGLAAPITVRLDGDTAWLSVASGLQNVAYGAAIQDDSLVLQADGAEVLRWRIAQDTSRHALVLTAGGGLYFLKAPPH